MTTPRRDRAAANELTGPPPARPRSRAALTCTCLLVAVHFALLAASLPDYRTNVDSGYHVTMARWYAQHGTAFWDHVNFAPAGRPNLQGPALHVATAIVGRVLGGGPEAYVLANAALALLQWAAAVGTAIYFARREAGDWAGLFAAALLSGNGLASYSFAIGIPSGWTFILAPWTIDFFLQRRLVPCIVTTALAIYSHLAGYATAPVGVFVAAVLTRRWRDLISVGVGVLLATAPYTIHVLRHLDWIHGLRGQAAPALAVPLYLLSLPAVFRMLRNPWRNMLHVAWAAEPAAWLLQNPVRYLGQVTLLCSVLGGVLIAELVARLPRRIRPAMTLAIILLSTMQSPLNDSAMQANARWLGGVRYPREVDWAEAREVAEVLRREGLSDRLVSSYNPTPFISTGAFTPLLLEKGHWVEVRPPHDPADQLSAGGKVYALPLPPDDGLLRQFEDHGWIRIRGGGAKTTIATLPSPSPAIATLLPVIRQSLADQALWIAEHAINNAGLPDGLPLSAWRETLLLQRTAAGRLQIATLLWAYAIESADAASASALRGAARGIGSLAYFLGDEGAARFVSEARHERMRVHARALAEAAREMNGSAERLRPVIAAFRILSDDYFAID